MSQPVQNGSGVLRAGIPPRTQRSRWFSAQARTRTSASPAPGVGVGTSSTWTRSGPPNSWKTAAFILRLLRVDSQDTSNGGIENERACRVLTAGPILAKRIGGD